MFILIRLTQHVSGFIMPIVRRTDYVKKLHVVYARLCWLQSCRVGTRAVCTVWKLVYQLSHSAHSIMMHETCWI